MRPFVPAATADLAERLRTDIVPEVAGFRAGNVGMTAAMLDMIGQEWDRAAARLVEENSAMRALLVRGAALIGGPQPLDDPNADLHVSALEAANEALRQGLITLQSTIEERINDEARALDEAIWDELRRSVERRRIASANF